MKPFLAPFLAFFTIVISARHIPHVDKANVTAPVAGEMDIDTTSNCTMDIIENMMFGVSMNTFQKARRAKIPSKCIWSTDNCTSSPDRPFGFNFKPSCQRHDFGYHNLRKLRRLNKKMRKRVDVAFKQDLYDYCSTMDKRAYDCSTMADLYYVAVRIFGGKIQDIRDARISGEKDKEEKRKQGKQRLANSAEHFDDSAGKGDGDGDGDGEKRQNEERTLQVAE